MPVAGHFHGGGWVIANLDTYESSAMALAHKAKAIVASVEYRHAPENKFPAAHDDAFAAYQWVLANAGQFAGDTKRVAVAGESAGGNLAANVAIAARGLAGHRFDAVVADAAKAQDVAAKDLREVSRRSGP